MDDEHQAYVVSGKVVTNWSKTFSCTPEFYYEPEYVGHMQQVLELARKHKKVVRVMGCGQSPSDLPFTNDYLISLNRFDQLLEVNKELKQIKVQAGVTLRKLNEDYLPKNDLALPINGAISDITLSGAISTGTHNSGVGYGTIASYVVELEVLTADGKLHKCNRKENSELFLATCCGLGAMGVIVTITYQCEKAFNLKQSRSAGKLDQVLNTLDVHKKSSDHFRFNWFPHTNEVALDHITRTDEPVTKQSTSERIHSWIRDYAVGYFLLEFIFWISTFIPSLVPKINHRFFQWLHKTSRTRIERGDKVFNIECLFNQYVNEWSIPADKAGLVLYELKEWFGKNPDVYAHFPVEVRFVKSEEFYLSPTFGRDSCYINILMYRPYGKNVPYQRYWDAYESIMKKAGGRPHWAKAHHVTAQEFRTMYPHFEAWCNLRRKYDPNDLFKNAYMDRILS